MRPVIPYNHGRAGLIVTEFSVRAIIVLYSKPVGRFIKIDVESAIVGSVRSFYQILYTIVPDY